MRKQSHNTVPHGLTQPTLLTPQSALDMRFNEFIEAHSDVYEAFKRRAWYLRNRGKRRLSAHSIGYYLRDESPIDSRDGTEVWKFNNSYSSRLARMLIAEEPSFAAFFELRRLQDGSSGVAA